MRGVATPRHAMIVWRDPLHPSQPRTMPRTSPSTLPPPSPADDADALTFFWELVESRTVGDVQFLLPQLVRQRRELAALAKREDIRETLWHPGRALDESESWSDWGLREKRSAILRAMRNASK